MANDQAPKEAVAAEVLPKESEAMEAGLAPRVLPPDEFSKQVFRELTFLTIPIEHKQIQKENLDQIVKECAETAKDLFEKGFIDAKTLYRISAGRKEYSGADKEVFMEIFSSSQRINFLKITVTANFDRQRRTDLLSLDFDVGSLASYLSHVRASGNDEMWVKNTYSRFSLMIDEFGNANRFLYSTLTEFIVQIFAVFVIFALSVSSTQYTDPKSSQFSHVFVFAAVFLFGSNTWTYLSRTLMSLRTKYFPVVSFKGRSAEKGILSFLGLVFVLVLGWSISTCLDFIKGKLVNQSSAQISAAGPQTRTSDK